MRTRAHSLTVFAAIAAHLLLAGVQIPHCHAAHDHAADHDHAGVEHVAHGHGHGHRHAHGHTCGEEYRHHVPHAAHGHHHAGHVHHGDGCRHGDEQPDCKLCLDAHETALAIPVRMERGGESGGDAARGVGMSVALLEPAPPSGARQMIGHTSHAASRASSVHDLLPHVLRM